jgi:hypothetical protein
MNEVKPWIHFTETIGIHWQTMEIVSLLDDKSLPIPASRKQEKAAQLRNEE